MTRAKRKAFILRLLDLLRKKGSWAGETHIQKATYCMQEITNVPTEFDFILYKHGPFSFDLRDELTLLRVDGFIKLINQFPYGPSLSLTDNGAEFLKQYPKTLGMYNDKIEFIADALSDKGIARLERLSTALYVTQEEASSDVSERADRITDLKPHIPEEFARQAVIEIDDLVSRSTDL